MDQFLDPWKKHDEDVKWESKIRRMVHEEVMGLRNSPEFSS